MEDVSLDIDQIEQNLTISRGEKPDVKVELDKLASLSVFDEFGCETKFGSLYSTRKTIIVFIRHFLCFITKEYVDDLAIIPENYLKAADVDLVVIGCGNPKYIKPFRQVTGYKGPLYVNPDLSIYKGVGLFGKHKRNTEPDKPRQSPHVKSNFVSGILKATWRGMQYRDMQGDMNQQGGALIVGPGDVVHFHHFDTTAYDHAPINDLLSFTSVDTVNFPKDKRVLNL